MSTTSKETAQKDKNYWNVLNAVIRLEVLKGHLLWKITDLARLSGVGRPLIYYYFGKSKKEIVETALKLIGDEFFGLSEERMDLWRQGEAIKSVLKTREFLRKAPYVSVFYFHWRHREGEIAAHLKKLEKRYISKLSQWHPEKSPEEVEALFACLFGLILLPDVKESTIHQVLGSSG